jgi:hypothetical protein
MLGARSDCMSKLIILFTFIVLIANGAQIVCAEQPSVSVKTYAIKSIPFSGYETTPDISKIPIIFSEYGKMVKVVYPATKDILIKDTAVITKNCKKALLENVDKIVETETKNQTVKDYLTSNGAVPFDKKILLAIIRDPREKTFQYNTIIGKSVAEFRSKEFDVNDNAKLCIYITFLCDSEKASVEKIVISAVRLEVE